MQDTKTTRLPFIVFWGLILGVFLRLLLLPNPGFEADVSFWKSWGLAIWDHGIVWSLHNTNNNYPAPFAYLLWIMIALYRLFANPHDFQTFWINTNIPFLTIAKVFPVAADLGVAGILLWIGKHAKHLGFPLLNFRLYGLLSLVYVFNPVSLIDGAWWGQVDSVGLVIFLLSVVCIFKKKPFWAGLLYMAAVMTKLQNMIYGPIFFLFLWQNLGYEGLIQSLAGAAVAFFGLNIEFVLARDMNRVISSLTDNYDYFPLLSLNAYNLWWIVARGAGMQMSDKITAIGIVNAKTLGLSLFSGVYLFAMLKQIFHTGRTKRSGNDTVIRTFLEGLITVNAGFFLFMTQSHERYAFPLIVFLLLWAPFWIVDKLRMTNDALPAGRQELRIKPFIIFYCLFSLLYFYNLHTALVINYPANGIPYLNHLVQPGITMAVAFVFLSLFGLWLLILKKSTPWWIYSIPLAAVMLTIAITNAPILRNQPVSVTKLVPIVSQQGYGQRQTNMPVNASLGFAKWSPLSVQYAFYRHGIGTHANSTITYDINRQFRRFSFDYGIDTEAGPKGSALFEVYGDGKLLFQSEKIARFDNPRHHEINIKDIQFLSLVTTDAEDGITDDHTDWLNTYLIP